MSLRQDTTAVERLHDAASASVEAFMACKRRILIVDDDAAVRETLADLLEFTGFYPVQAGGAAEALTILDLDPAIDALVTDLSMPMTDGISLIHQARKLRSDLPAILLTGCAVQIEITATVAEYDFRVLRKPVDGDCLAAELDLLFAARPASE